MYSTSNYLRFKISDTFAFSPHSTLSQQDVKKRQQVQIQEDEKEIVQQNC